jgi:hypothetical protein
MKRRAVADRRPRFASRNLLFKLLFIASTRALGSDAQLRKNLLEILEQKAEWPAASVLANVPTTRLATRLLAKL